MASSVWAGMLTGPNGVTAFTAAGGQYTIPNDSSTVTIPDSSFTVLAANPGLAQLANVGAIVIVSG